MRREDSQRSWPADERLRQRADDDPGGVRLELTGRGERDPGAAEPAASSGAVAIERSGHELPQDPQPAVAEEHEVELAVVEDGVRRDLEAPAVPRAVAHHRLQDPLPASASVDLDLHARAALADERAQRREREAALTALDRAAPAERARVDADPRWLDEDLPAHFPRAGGTPPRPRG